MSLKLEAKNFSFHTYFLFPLQAAKQLACLSVSFGISRPEACLKLEGSKLEGSKLRGLIAGGLKLGCHGAPKGLHSLNLGGSGLVEQFCSIT